MQILVRVISGRIISMAVLDQDGTNYPVDPSLKSNPVLEEAQYDVGGTTYYEFNNLSPIEVNEINVDDTDGPG